MVQLDPGFGHHVKRILEESAPKTIEFNIFGDNISHSLSPAMHNASFKALGCPAQYSMYETEGVEKILQKSSFGGASVTPPHKLQIGRLLDVVSPRAVSIGAINTIAVRYTDAGRILEGDNTDWIGIKACIVKSSIPDPATSSAIVLGAGGAARAACYASEALGISEAIIVNRTLSKAKQMQLLLPSLKSQVVSSLDDVLLSLQVQFPS